MPRIVTRCARWQLEPVIEIPKNAEQATVQGTEAKPVSSVQSSAAASPAAPAYAVGKRVLVAENEPAVMELIRMLLQADGHLVTEARSGRDACLLYAPGDFDLIIAEHDMPEMNGAELARTIKCLVPAQPILMLTTYAEKVCSDENPVNAVLERPFTVGALRGIVSILCAPRGPAAQAA